MELGEEVVAFERVRRRTEVDLLLLASVLLSEDGVGSVLEFCPGSLKVGRRLEFSARPLEALLLLEPLQGRAEVARRLEFSVETVLLLRLEFSSRSLGSEFAEGALEVGGRLEFTPASLDVGLGLEFSAASLDVRLGLEFSAARLSELRQRLELAPMGWML